MTWTPTLSQYFIRGERKSRGCRRWQKPAGRRIDRRDCSPPKRPRLGGFFRKIVDFHERWLRRALAQPVWLAALSLVLVVALVRLLSLFRLRPDAGDG